MRDHQINGSAILPGAAYLELAVASNSSLTKLPSPVACVANASINAPLVIASDSQGGVSLVLQLSLDDFKMNIISRNKSNEISHLSAQFNQAVQIDRNGRRNLETGSSKSMEVARAQCSLPRDSGHIYSEMNSAGLQYGPAFRRMRNIHGNRTDACSQIVVGDATNITTGYKIHPSVLDNTFQLGAVIEEDGVSKDETFVPAAIDAFVVVDSVHSREQIMAQSKARSSEHLGGTLRDHRLQTSDGADIMHLQGLLAKPMTSSGRQVSRRVVNENITYTVQRQVDHVHHGVEIQGNLISVKYQDHATQHAGNMLSALKCIATREELAVSVNSTHGNNKFGEQAQGDWGMIRSLAAEMPGLTNTGYLTDINMKKQHGTEISILSEPSVSDGYGSLVSGNAADLAVLLESTQRQKPPAYHLMPRPRGAFGNLVPEPVEIDAVGVGKVEIQVQSVESTLETSSTFWACTWGS
eukprot:jgi/Picre1/29090/NNA_004483.t1